MKEGRPIETELVTPPTFRQLAQAVDDDKTLDDPFLDGFDSDSDDSTDDRDTLKAILTKHYGYSSDEVEEVDDKTCRFTGRNKQSIAITSAHDDQGTPFLELTVSQEKLGRIISSSLKLGAPIAIALAHQNSNKLNKIFNSRISDPVVTGVGQFKASYHTPAAVYSSTTRVWSLKSNSFVESNHWVGGDLP